MGGNEKLKIPVSKLILRLNSKGLKIVFRDNKHFLKNPSGRQELHPLNNDVPRGGRDWWHSWPLGFSFTAFFDAISDSKLFAVTLKRFSSSNN